MSCCQQIPQINAIIHHHHKQLRVITTTRNTRVLYRYSVLFIKIAFHLRTGFVLCQAWARVPTPEDQNAQTRGPRFNYHLRLVRTSTPICYPTAKHRYGCLHHCTVQYYVYGASIYLVYIIISGKKQERRKEGENVLAAKDELLLDVNCCVHTVRIIIEANRNFLYSKVHTVIFGMNKLKSKQRFQRHKNRGKMRTTRRILGTR